MAKNPNIIFPGQADDDLFFDLNPETASTEAPTVQWPETEWSSLSLGNAEPSPSRHLLSPFSPMAPLSPFSRNFPSCLNFSDELNQVGQYDSDLNPLGPMTLVSPRRDTMDRFCQEKQEFPEICEISEKDESKIEGFGEISSSPRLPTAVHLRFASPEQRSFSQPIFTPQSDSDDEGTWEFPIKKLTVQIPILTPLSEGLSSEFDEPESEPQSYNRSDLKTISIKMPSFLSMRANRGGAMKGKGHKKKNPAAKRASPEAKEAMREWLKHNLYNPFPDQEQKAKFEALGATRAQVNNFFMNQRKRNIKPCWMREMSTQALFSDMQAFAKARIGVSLAK